jgi:ABC-2 type transport system ATP-binding protein
MRQRVGVAQALVNDPELVLLDEPTDGVDPVGRRDIRGICQRLKEQGKTVFVNSHLLSELELICDRVAILVQGQVSAQGTIDELTRGQQRYEIEILANGDARTAFEGALPAIRAGGTQRLATGEAISLQGTTLTLATADAERIQGVLDAIRSRGVVVRSVRPVRPSLEDLFMRAVTDPVTGETLAPGAAARGKPRP